MSTGTAASSPALVRALRERDQHAARLALVDQALTEIDAIIAEAERRIAEQLQRHRELEPSRPFGGWRPPTDDSPEQAKLRAAMDAMTSELLQLEPARQAVQQQQAALQVALEQASQTAARLELEQRQQAAAADDRARAIGERVDWSERVSAIMARLG